MIQTIINKPNGYQIAIKQTRTSEWRVMVHDTPGKRCYVAGPDAWMDDYPMALKWAHIVMRDMIENRIAVKGGVA